MQWKGPYPVLKKIALHDYCLDVDGKEHTFHANLLKKYIDRTDSEDRLEIVRAAASLRHVSHSVIHDEVEEGMIEVRLLPIEQMES